MHSTANEEVEVVVVEKEARTLGLAPAQSREGQGRTAGGGESRTDTRARRGTAALAQQGGAHGDGRHGAARTGGSAARRRWRWKGGGYPGRCGGRTG